MKNTYLISYEHDETFHDYAPLIEKIKSFDDWCHPLYPIWFVKTELTANQIYEKIKPLLRDKDRVFIMNIIETSDRQGYLSKNFWNWLRKN